DELDRVLDRDHVTRARLVDVIEHRRGRRRLPVGRRAGDDDETASAIGEAPDDLRTSELGERGDARGHETEGRRDAGVLHVVARAEAGDVLKGVTELESEIRRESRSLRRRDQLEEHVFELLRAGHRFAQRYDLAADASHRRLIDAEVEIAPAALDQVLEE